MAITLCSIGGWADWEDDASPATRAFKERCIAHVIKNHKLDSDAASTLRSELPMDQENATCPLYAARVPAVWPLCFIEPSVRHGILLKQLLPQVRQHLTKSLVSGNLQTVFSVVSPSGKEYETSFL